MGCRDDMEISNLMTEVIGIENKGRAGLAEGEKLRLRSRIPHPRSLEASLEAGASAH